MAVPAFFFTFSIYLQVGHGFSALQAGLSTFSYAVGAAVISRRAGAVAKKLGTGVLILGTAFMLAGTLVLAATVLLAGNDPSVWAFVPGTLLEGIGFGFFVPSVIGVILANVHVDNAGSASGALATSQQVGGAIGVAAIGILFFGFVSVHAPTAAATVAPTVQVGLVTAGVPADPAAAAALHFQDCFVRQSQSVDPTLTPAGCGSAAADPALTTVFADAANTAKGDNFTGAILVALAAEVLVFLVVLFLAVLLRREEKHLARSS